MYWESKQGEYQLHKNEQQEISFFLADSKVQYKYAKIQTLTLVLTIPGTSHLTALHFSFLSSGQGLFNEEQWYV